MRAHIVGVYVVDEKEFPIDLIDDWVRQGGSMSLFPYLREQVYGLTARCGITPVILPIVQILTVKIAPSEERSASASSKSGRETRSKRKFRLKSQQ